MVDTPTQPSGFTAWWRWLLIPVIIAGLKMYMGGPPNPFSETDMRGKVCLITGANTGIGRETALELARQNATVILAGRDAKRVGEAVKAVLSVYPFADVSSGIVDLSSLSSVNAFAGEMSTKLTSIDRLILNAGVMVPPYTKTSEGFELQWGTNHVGHQALTQALLPLVRKTRGSRVIVVSSSAHAFGNVAAAIEDPSWSSRNYSSVRAYGDSKHANVLMAQHLQTLLKSSGSDALAFSLHPGAIDTELQRHAVSPLVKTLMTPVLWLLLKNAWQGAQTQLYLATAPSSELAPHAGRYFDCNAPLDNSTWLGRLMVHPAQFDAGLAERLWTTTEAAIKATGKMTTM